MKKSAELIKKSEVPPASAAPLVERPPVPFYPSSRYDAYPGEVSSGYNRLHEYWGSVRKHFLLVIAIVVLVTALTTVYMARQPDVYESLSRVQVDLETANNPAIGALKGNSIFLNTPLQDPTYFNTQITILTSAGLLGRVAKTLDLEHNQAFLRPQSTQNHSLWESLKGLVGASRSPAPPKPPEDNKLRPSSALAADDVVEANHYEPYVEMLQSQLSVKQLSDTRIIEISFRHQDPEVAEKINNMVAETFVLSNLERKTCPGIVGVF